MTETAAATIDEQPFSAVLRASTASGHSAAEGGEFLGALGPGTFTLADFAALTQAHLTIYRALETAAAELATDPVAGPFVIDGLARTARLEADLRVLATLTPAPATVSAAVDYAARITEVAGDPARFIAHHYTRYLGDLSGGQMIRHALLKLHPELEMASSFYDFPDLGPLGSFKKHYRTLLDSIGEDHRDRMIDEVQLAYDLNVKVFVALDQLRRTA